MPIMSEGMSSYGHDSDVWAILLISAERQESRDGQSSLLSACCAIDQVYVARLKQHVPKSAVSLWLRAWITC